MLFDEVCSCPEGIEHERVKTHFLGTIAERRERHLRATIWKGAGIPKRFIDYTLENSPVGKTNPAILSTLRYPVRPYPEKAPQWSEDDAKIDAWVAATTRWVESWFLWGPYGTGKTGLAVGLAREWLENEWEMSDGGIILFRSVPRLLSDIRGTYNRKDDSTEPTEAELLEQYTKCALLVLDDLGAEQVKNSGWVEDRLFQIIGERHDNLLPTIFTSNLSLKEVADRIGERIAWRIAEMVGKDHIIHVDGPNLRDVG